MKISHFLEYALTRMEYIFRWSLMRNTKQEDLKQHSFDVAVLAHLLVLICNHLSSGTNKRQLDPGKAAVYALYHDTAEVFTGDFPTPLKQFGGGAIKAIADKLESLAIDKMVGTLPEELQGSYREVFAIPPEYKALVKAADRIAALRKCRAEIAAGNQEFAPAAARLEETLKESNLPEVDYFMERFMPVQPVTLEQLIGNKGEWVISALEGGASCE